VESVENAEKMTFWDRMTPEQKKDPALFWVNFLNPERGARALQAMAKVYAQINSGKATKTKETDQ